MEMEPIVNPGPSRQWLVLVIGGLTFAMVLYNPSFWPQPLAAYTGTAGDGKPSPQSPQIDVKLTPTATPSLSSEMTQSAVPVTTTASRISDVSATWGVTSTHTDNTGNLAGSSLQYSYSAQLETVTKTSEFSSISKVAESGRAQRRLSFNNRFVNCNKNNVNNLSSSITDSCDLNLKVAPIANLSLDFNTLDKKLTDAWAQVPDDKGTDFNSNSSLKYILLWHEKKLLKFGEGRSQFLKAGCPINNCYITTNRSLLSSANVAGLLLHLWWIVKENVSLPERKDFPNARMILWAGEAPIRMPKGVGRFSGLVDYVVSYRRDADVVRTTGSVIPMKEASSIPEGQMKNFAANKTKMAAWFVSNCNTAPSMRNLLTSELQRHGVVVDIFGECGQLSCPREDEKYCYRMLESRYKFYLSFENSLCNHYVTEKFYNILRYDVVPVTYGLGHELTGAPKDAYVDVLDFPNVRAVADHLLFLDANDDAYNQYFRWKKYYEVTPNYGPYNALCEVCAALTPGPAPPVPDQYRDLEAWYSEGQCLQVTTSDRLRTFLGLP